MGKQAWLWIALAIIIIAGIVYVVQSGPAVPRVDEEAPGIANPASTNCVNLGGTLEIVDEAEGQIGLCHLPDGRVCEEWALFRDGACITPD